MKNKLNLALFISGGATTACAIINACRLGKLNINPVLVVASNKKISGIERITQTGFAKDKIIIINPQECKGQVDFADRLLSACRKKRIDLVGQYGWLPLTPVKFIGFYKDRIINQHPGPLDPPRSDFGGKGMYGRRVHAAVLYFRRMTKREYWTEAVSHLVTEKLDRGEIIRCRKIDILPVDTVEDLQKRVLPIEHEVQIEALQDFSSDAIKFFMRSKPLIEKSEFGILQKAKAIAAVFYPHG